MLFRQSCSCAFLLAFFIGLPASLGFAQKPARSKPTASLPIEPASADHDILEDKSMEPTGMESRAIGQVKARPQRSQEASEIAAQAALLMTRDGFGAQLHVLEYTQPWLAMSQSLRFEKQEQSANALYESRYGLMLGLELHPWRSARFSPVLNLRAGGDRFLRGWQKSALDLFGFEAAAGLELKLARAASFLFQWSEVYYPDLDEQLFTDQKLGQRYAGSFQVFFNLRWESAM